MKIAVWQNLPSGGGRRALYNHLLGLAARGHTIDMWCPPTADLRDLPFEKFANIHVVDLRLPIRFRRSDEWQVTLETQRALGEMEVHCRECAAEIDDGGFDILFANTCQLFRTPSIGRFAKTPSVLYLQEPYRWLYEALPRLCWLAPPERPNGRLTIKALRDAFVDMRNLRNRRVQAREEVNNAAAFACLLVNSYFSRESILRAYGLNADVCYLGIDNSLFTDTDQVRDDLIVGLGSITREKNLELCILAVAAIPVPRPRLVWIGNVADRETLKAMQALAAEKDVEFEPLVGISDDILIATLQRASMMVYAPRLEPFGLAPLEANACGVPVVAVAEGGVRETVVDGVTGLLVDSSPAAMAAGIERLRKDPTFARRLGADAKANVADKWNLEASIDRIEAQLKRFARSNNTNLVHSIDSSYPT